MPDDVVKAMTRRFAMGPLLYAAATLLGLLNAWLSIATYVVLIGVYMLRHRPRRAPEDVEG